MICCLKCQLMLIEILIFTQGMPCGETNTLFRMWLLEDTVRHLAYKNACILNAL